MSIHCFDASVDGFSLGYAGQGSVRSEDAAKADSAEAKGIPMMGGRSLVERSSVHERIVCRANVRTQKDEREKDLPWRYHAGVGHTV